MDACESEGRLEGDARDDGTDVEGEDGRVHVYLVRMEDGRVIEYGKDRIWKPRREGILIRAVPSYIRRGEAFTTRGGVLAWCISVLLLDTSEGGERRKLEALACGTVRTMENLGLLQEPLEPTPVKLEFLEFLENTTLVNFGIVCKLCTLYERKYDGVLEADEDGPDPVEGERVS